MILVLVAGLLFGCGKRALLLDEAGVEADGPVTQAPQSKPKVGPTFCRRNDDCWPGAYCFRQGCLMDKGPRGECLKRPTSCPLMARSEPVCGCDGKTYNGAGACEAARAGVNVARDGACSDDPACEGVRCGVHNNCCQCDPYDLAKPSKPIDCPAICDAPMCQGWGIAKPLPYCLGGKCFLTDKMGACTSDADCALVNNCCHCLALPAKVAELVQSQCTSSLCKPACDALGLGSVKARCRSGICRLSRK